MFVVCNIIGCRCRHFFWIIINNIESLSAMSLHVFTTLQGTSISHLGKIKTALVRDMLLPRRGTPLHMPRFYPPPCSYCHTSAETRRKSFMSKCPTVQFFGPCFLGWFGLLRSNVCERNSAPIPQCIGQKVKQHWYKNTAQTFKTVAYNQGATVDQLCSRWEPFPLIFCLDILRFCYNPSSLKIQHLKPAQHLFFEK